MVMNEKEKGVTLIEVLISIVILSIIFLSFMRFFPQMGFMNNENADKTQAINTAKEILIEWQESEDLKNFLKNPTGTFLQEYVKTEAGYYYFKTVESNYNVYIKIKISSDLVSTPNKTFLIQVELLNKRNNIISETYGYIIL
ncbi:prepilin-type N-terminal cleavage/methylation domain-containing protein [Bacillus sp. SLBN-46]|uniref:prepilin-type N-terminal cleavage/methylation domain-containing protein n=1 Tax=Bacillus sp. SLBN-46 TaxID=3042283 RepID=UPI002866D703|nr:prepilin-type N-terminal cleavage/methylation domain-containing protein [Bacillus sp. SLBN-46]MDR6122187.1 prepilin-type N-terminal cleavage/methylation domain-containing protein [Bacillus sp. SLBN-46]